MLNRLEICSISQYSQYAENISNMPALWNLRDQMMLPPNIHMKDSWKL